MSDENKRYGAFHIGFAFVLGAGLVLLMHGFGMGKHHGRKKNANEHIYQSDPYNLIIREESGHHFYNRAEKHHTWTARDTGATIGSLVEFLKVEPKLIKSSKGDFLFQPEPSFDAETNNLNVKFKYFRLDGDKLIKVRVIE